MFMTGKRRSLRANPHIKGQWRLADNISGRGQTTKNRILSPAQTSHVGLHLNFVFAGRAPKVSS